MELTRRTLTELIAASVLKFPTQRTEYNSQEASWHLDRVNEDADTVRIVFEFYAPSDPEEVRMNVIVGGAAGAWWTSYHEIGGSKRMKEHSDLWLALCTARSWMQD